MDVGRGEQEEEGQTRPAAEEGMDAVAAQKRARMVVRGMPHGRIRIRATPRQDRGAVNDEVASADETTVKRESHQHDEQRLGSWRPSPRGALPLLRWAGHMRSAARIHGQAAGEREGRPYHKPVAQIPIGEPPEGAQQGKQQE
jgi:hypothetical protein